MNWKRGDSMTENEARKILQDYRETDDDTGEKYGYVIQECCGTDGDGFVFRCKIEGVDYDALDAVMGNLPLMAVYPDGTVVNVPLLEGLK